MASNDDALWQAIIAQHPVETRIPPLPEVIGERPMANKAEDLPALIDQMAANPMGAMKLLPQAKAGLADMIARLEACEAKIKEWSQPANP